MKGEMLSSEASPYVKEFSRVNRRKKKTQKNRFFVSVVYTINIYVLEIVWKFNYCV